MGLSRPGRDGIRSAAPTGRNGRTNWAARTGQPPLALWADPTRWSGRTSCAARLSARPPPVEAARHRPKIQAFITTRHLLGTAAHELAIGPLPHRRRKVYPERAVMACPGQPSLRSSPGAARGAAPAAYLADGQSCQPGVSAWS